MEIDGPRGRGITQAPLLEPAEEGRGGAAMEGAKSPMRPDARASNLIAPPAFAGATPPGVAKHDAPRLLSLLTNDPEFRRRAGDAQFFALGAEDLGENGRLTLDVEMPVADAPPAYLNTHTRYRVSNGMPLEGEHEALLHTMEQAAAMVQMAAGSAAAQAFLSLYPEAIAHVRATRDRSHVSLELERNGRTSALGVDVGADLPTIYGVREPVDGALFSPGFEAPELESVLHVMRAALHEAQSGGERSPPVECIAHRLANGSFSARCH